MVSCSLCSVSLRPSSTLPNKSLGAYARGKCPVCHTQIDAPEVCWYQANQQYLVPIRKSPNRAIPWSIAARVWPREGVERGC